MSTIHMTMARIDTLDDLLAIIARDRPETVERCVEMIKAMQAGYKEALDYFAPPVQKCAACSNERVEGEPWCAVCLEKIATTIRDKRPIEDHMDAVNLNERMGP